jgi:hypothetical protein
MDHPVNQKLNTIRRHVLDDTWELIKAKNVVEPLISSPSLNWIKANAQQAAHFLRMQLTRQVILILTRLNALPNSGRTGETASILAVLNEASAARIITQAAAQIYLDKLSKMKENISKQGTSFEDLVTFRNSELAHSLHNVKVIPNGLSYFVISQFAEDTIELVGSLEADLVSHGCPAIIASIREFDGHWSKCGSEFWQALTP